MQAQVSRAQRDTWNAVVNGPVQYAVCSTLIFLCGPVTVVWRHWGSWRAVIVSLAEWWHSAWLGLLYLAIAAVIMFLWNLICAPYRIQKERADAAEKALALQRVDPLREREIAAQERLVEERRRENDRIDLDRSPAGAIIRYYVANAPNRLRSPASVVVSASEMVTAADTAPKGARE